MSKHNSPLLAPVMDEDFDLCISETNLPFPYSDHCSTGPPSLYGLDEEDEDDDDDEEEVDEDVDEELDRLSMLLRKEVLLGDTTDDTLTSPRPASNRSSRDLKGSIKDLSGQLHDRLEHIHETDPTLTPTKEARPKLTPHGYSFDSTGGWHEDDEEDLHGQNQVTPAEQQDQGLIQTVTSAVTSVAYAVGQHWTKKIYESLLRSRDPQAYYTHLLSAATNYEQWAEAAAILDQLQGKDKWKNDPASPHYDYELLQGRLSQLLSARESGDLGLMIFLLRTSLSRYLGNVGRPQLYANTIIGTKRLIEDYNSEVIRQLNIICDTESDDFSMAAKLEFFTHTRQAFGRTALLLSGGATMGLIHIGVIKTLFENQLLPRIISGSSCGSIIAAILCTRTDEEIPQMLQFERFNFTVFHSVEEQGDVMARIIHFLKNGALFDAEVLKAALKDNIGDVTFQEAYNRTRRILNVTVSTAATFEMPRLLNYLTAPNVLIWSAVATSCAAPFIYNSAPLMAKDKNGEVIEWHPSNYHWIDGSVENDLPMNKLSELFNVNHFIVCQVNPYIVPFLQNSLARSPTNRVLGWMLYQARSEMQHRMNQLSLLGVMPGLIHKAQAIMSQRYYGDITIVPDLGVEDYLNIVSNPTIEFLVDASLKGERATWPKISIIKNHCSIEHCIDDILYRLRLRRLEAYRAYPQAQSSMANKASGKTAAFDPTTHPHPTASTTTLRGSVSVCFGAIGRSSSSPASPTLSNVGMSRTGSPLEAMEQTSAQTGLVTSVELGPKGVDPKHLEEMPSPGQTFEALTKDGTCGAAPPEVAFSPLFKPSSTLRRESSGHLSSGSTGSMPPLPPQKRDPMEGQSTTFSPSSSPSTSRPSSQRSVSGSTTTRTTTRRDRSSSTTTDSHHSGAMESLGSNSRRWSSSSGGSSSSATGGEHEGLQPSLTLASPIPSFTARTKTVRTSSSSSNSSSSSTNGNSSRHGDSPRKGSRGDSGLTSSSSAGSAPRSKRDRSFQMTSLA